MLVFEINTKYYFTQREERERERRENIYIHIYIYVYITHTHTHTHIYIYIYKRKVKNGIEVHASARNFNYLGSVGKRAKKLYQSNSCYLKKNIDLVDK